MNTSQNRDIFFERARRRKRKGRRAAKPCGTKPPPRKSDKHRQTSTNIDKHRQTSTNTRLALRRPNTHTFPSQPILETP
ncbi:hypothetical protein CKA38_04165 [Ereboglobus luteus]|uniref:Uncharacterized protein n=1 Tax=Ereboglobus luteus TaxID=1796921 RepID=A0A2U8E125_9BACT|nr:hypothetical protein CKA38_04165 [Ereboglobus luteus]